MTREQAIVILTERLGYSMREVEKDPVGMLQALGVHPELGQLDLGQLVVTYTGLRAYIVSVDYVAGTFTAQISHTPGAGSAPDAKGTTP